MKTKTLKIFLLLTIIGVFSNNLMAQKMYAHVNVGYGLKMGTQTLLNNSTFVSYDDHYTGEVEVIDVSFGKGLNLGAAFGCMFTKNLGAELGLSYLLGGKTKSEFDDTDYFGGITSHTTGETSVSAKMFRIIPSVVLAAGLDKIDPYAKFGVVLGFGCVKVESNENDDGDVYEQVNKLNGGMAFGLSSAFGVKYNLNEKMSLFGEFNMINMSYAPKKGEVIEYTENGADKLPSMTTNDKEIEYVKDYSYDSSNPTPDSEPDKATSEKLPFSSIGLNVGFRINF